MQKADLALHSRSIHDDKTTSICLNHGNSCGLWIPDNKAYVVDTNKCRPAQKMDVEGAWTNKKCRSKASMKGSTFKHSYMTARCMTSCYG